MLQYLAVLLIGGPAPSRCECARTFDQVVSEVERNYSGYADKVTRSTIPGYNALKHRVRARALKAGSSAECARALDGYVAFFRDGHIQVRGADSRKPVAVRREVVARQIDAQTTYLLIPSFTDDYSARINSALDKVASQLDKGRNLIIDVRGNGGGSDDNFSRLLPLMYTKPIAPQGVALYATEDNIRRWQAIAVNPEVPAETRRWLAKRVENMLVHRGSFALEPADTFRLEEKHKNPERIAILVDRGCKSGCEAFILAAHQSAKVTLYGTNTGGVLDYANVLGAPLASCGDLQLRYASSRSTTVKERPVDPAGIPAHIRIPAAVRDTLKWVKNDMVNHAKH